MTMPINNETLQSHEYADIFPMISDERFKSLVADIKDNGLIEPIWLLDGKVLDGRNRLKACIETGIKPEFRQYTGNDPLQFVLSLNLERRHLDTADYCALADKVAEVLEKEAKEKQREAGENTHGHRHQNKDADLQLVAELPQAVNEEEPFVDYEDHDEEERNERIFDEIQKRDAYLEKKAERKTRDKAVEITGNKISGRTYQDYKRLEKAEDHPDIFERVKAKEISVSAGIKELNARLKAEEKAKKQKALEEKRKQALSEAAAKEEADKNLFEPLLINADCLSALKDIESESVQLAVIDPPYNMDKADWDSYGSGSDFADWCGLWLAEVQRVLKNDGALYVFGINRMLSHIQHKLDQSGMVYKNWIVWDTIQGAGGGLWVNRHESILYYSKSKKVAEYPDEIRLERHEKNVREYKGKEYRFKNPSNIWRFPCVDGSHHERTNHPTQKPVELIERIIKASSIEGDTVLDCFLGSGTTAVAAVRNSRHCIGIEQNPDYVEIAKQRVIAHV